MHVAHFCEKCHMFRQIHSRELPEANRLEVPPRDRVRGAPIAGVLSVAWKIAISWAE